MIRLRSLRPEDLPELADPRVVARGRDCVRWGLLHDLDESPGVIEAQVAERRGHSCRVVVREGSRGLVTSCTCPQNHDHAEVCRHIVAALIAWMARRDGTARGAAASEEEDGAPAGAPDSAVRRLRELARRLRAGAEPARAAVERAGRTHGLTITVHPRGGEGGGGAADEAAVRLVIPPGDVAAALKELDALEGVEWTEGADALRVYYSPVRMRLRADYAREGILVLTPIAVLKDHRGAGRVIEPLHLHEGLDGTVWVEDGPDTLRRVGLWTSLIEQYAPDFKPRILEGAEVVEFLRLGHETGWRGGLEPSERVRASRVVNEVRLARVAVSEGPGGWLYLDPVYRAGGHDLALADVLEAQRSGGLLQRGDDWIVIRGGAAWSRAGLVPADAPRDGDPVAEIFPEGAALLEGRIRTTRLAYLRQRAEWGPEVEVRADETLARFEAFLRREGPPPRAPAVKGMVGKLRPYQTAGYRWLWFLRESGLGGILADEMGLGKTHQVMALLLSEYGAADGPDGRAAPAPPGPSLVVCPRSVLDHWETKVRAHAPSLAPLVYHGHERGKDRASFASRRVVLTTYGVLARDADVLAEVAWDHVVLDEGQYVKNAATRAARAARKLRARHRLVLTGTPIENHLQELRSLMDFVLPGYLGSADAFRRRFADPIEAGDARAVEVLKRAIDPFKLRRLKSQVLTDLPPKIEDERHAALTPHQAVLYREILARARSSGLFDTLSDPTRRLDFTHVFAVISRLKRVCDHPLLVLEGKGGRHLTSGKFDLFKEVLAEALDAGEKVVVFSQYLEMLDLIEEHLKEIGVSYSELRGATRRRGAAVRAFQEDPRCRVFVASLLAGGLGVDLTAGTVVIHYDRWWNAAREDQATDRVHRIGQSRGVQVFRLITRGTLEERIDAIIREKRRLADRLVEADPALALKSLTRQELQEILGPPGDPAGPA
jgi:superfamily II DNA or RNA helicase